MQKKAVAPLNQQIMEHIYPFESQISYEQRLDMMRQTPRLIWLTGLSGSGKSTLALRLEHYLFHKEYKVFLLDGDNIRNGLNSDLSFTEQDRKENVRRVAEVAKLMLDAGLIVLGAFISPFREERNLVKQIVGESRFSEVYVNCSLEVCEERDIKGLYAKARRGIIPNFTGISAPYQSPQAPDMEVKTDEETIDESLFKLINHIEPQLKPQQKGQPARPVYTPD
jgi:adenylylsulfate kinase